jgi:hypothetical protein
VFPGFYREKSKGDEAGEEYDLPNSSGCLPKKILV